MSAAYPYLSYSGQPPTTQALGVGVLQQSVRPKRLFASSHWTTEAPRKFIVISPPAAQHHMDVCCPVIGTGCEPMTAEGVQQPFANQAAATRAKPENTRRAMIYRSDRKS